MEAINKGISFLLGVCCSHPLKASYLQVCYILYLLSLFCILVSLSIYYRVPTISFSFKHYRPQKLYNISVLSYSTIRDSLRLNRTSFPPNTVSQLTFTFAFNQKINYLPNSITQITFGASFNCPVDTLPHSITHLTFGDFFNQRIDSLPPSLTHLSLGRSFNHPIDSLPKTLKQLLLGLNFNYPIDLIPASITFLKFCHDTSYTNPVKSLPSQLTHLYIRTLFNSHGSIIDILPPSLTHLYVSMLKHPLDNLPKSITVTRGWLSLP